MFKSYFLIKKINPDIIISFGGYVSVPVVVSGWLQNKTTITHEQTLTNSLTTKINSYFVNKIALSFNNPKQISQLPQKKVVVTGNLLRYELFQKPKKPEIFINRLPTNKPLIFITAGNQGSHEINLNIGNILPKLTDFNIIHQTGKNDYPAYKSLIKKYQNYYPTDYFDTQKYSWIIQHSEIFISRAGANTCQEIVAFNKKSILIPLPKSQQNEQLLNALWVEKQQKEQTVILNQENLNPESLMDAIILLKKQKNISTKKRYQPNLKLLQLINEII